jgi:hypothetical protein
LNSGSPETGSTIGLTSVPTRASDENPPFQWIGTKIMPRGISPVMRKRTMMDPQRVATRTSSPSRVPASNASCACMSTYGSGT